MSMEDEAFLERRQRASDRQEEQWLMTPEEQREELDRIVASYGKRPYSSMAAATHDLASGKTFDLPSLSENRDSDKPEEWLAGQGIDGPAAEAEEPRLKLDPTRLSTVIAIHPDLSDLRTETWVRGGDGEWVLSSVERPPLRSGFHIIPPPDRVDP